METFWLKVYVGSVGTTNSLGSAYSEFGTDDLLGSLMNQTPGTSFGEEEIAKTRRLVEWNVEILTKTLKQIVARRASNPPKSSKSVNMASINDKDAPLLDEAKDILQLPQFDASTYRNLVDPATVKLPQAVLDQLNLFVTRIAASYRNGNPFHNFEHASHVTMSVSKLLSRIVNPIEVKTRKGELESVAEDLHDHTVSSGLVSHENEPTPWPD